MPILQNVEIKADLTKPVEVISKEVVVPPAKEISHGLTQIIRFATVSLDNAVERYEKKLKFKRERFLKQLEEKYTEIPTDNIVEPNMNVIGYTIENLKYNLDEDYLVDLYTNILISDMDKRTKSKCHVCFPDMLKQLSKYDLKLLTAIYNVKDTKSFPFGKLKIVNSKDKTINFEIHNSIYLSEIKGYFIYDYNQFSRSVENLHRLGLIEISYTNFFTDKKIYTNLINKVSPTCECFFGEILKDNPNAKLDCEPGILSISNMGYDLMKICLRDI